MKGTLRKQNDGWTLETHDETMVDSGEYPLIEDDAFIESAAENLEYWKYHNKPYTVIDERD